MFGFLLVLVISVVPDKDIQCQNIELCLVICILSSFGELSAVSALFLRQSHFGKIGEKYSPSCHDR